MRPKFLLDEHVDPVYQRQLRRRNSQIEVVRIGDRDTLPAGSDDPDILVWAAENDFVVVTEDRSTMPSHIANHISMGRKFAGLLWIRPETSPGRIVEELYLIWMASEAEEYRNQALYIPLQI